MRLSQRLGLMLLIAAGAAAVYFLERDLPIATVDARYRSSASAWLDLPDGGRLHYRDQGRGPAVVLVHGSTASLHTFEPWVAELERSYRIVTLDLPGHGLTGAVPSGRYGADSHQQALETLVAALGLSRFVLGGNSMGGGVSWRYALEHPEQVRALVLIDAAPPRGWRRQLAADGRSSPDAKVGDASPPRAFSLLRQPWFRAVARYLDPEPLIRQGLRASYGDASEVTDSLVARYRDLTLRRGTRAATLQRFGAPREPEAVDLSQLEMPALVLWGALDRVIPIEVGERFAQELPAAQWVRYDNLGHVPMEEAPLRTAADLRSFLEGLPNGDRP